MSFTANKAIRDIVTTALTDNLPALLTAVGTEQSVTLPALRKVYVAEEPKTLFPSAMLTPPRGTISDDAGLRTAAETWVIVSVTGSDPVRLNALLTGYTTSIVRLFARSSFSGVLFEAAEFDMSPPTEIDSTLIQSAGVLVRGFFLE